MYGSSPAVSESSNSDLPSDTTRGGVWSSRKRILFKKLTVAVAQDGNDIHAKRMATLRPASRSFARKFFPPPAVFACAGQTVRLPMAMTWTPQSFLSRKNADVVVEPEAQV